MRICIFNDNFYRGSGITIAIRRLFESGAFDDVDVYLAGCQTKDGRKNNPDDTSFIDPSRYAHFSLMQSGPGLPLELYRFVRWVRAMRIDLIHVHHRRLAVLANAMKPFTGVPVLFTGHLTFPHAGWFRVLGPKRMTGVSPTVVDYLQRCTRAHTVELVYNAVPFPKEGAPPTSQRGRAAIAVGRLDPVKGHNTLIDAYAKLRDRGTPFELQIYGEGSLYSVLQEQIDSLKLGEYVSLRGFDPNVVERLRHSAFNILVSEREGLPNVVVEAAALGIPTLVTDVDGSRDTLPPHSRLPNRIPFGNADALAEALAIWHSSPHLVEEDGRAFNAFLKPRCTPEIVGAEYRRIYTSMLTVG